jgi:formylglycine-generating enzyme required for sulfatase activity
MREDDTTSLPEDPACEPPEYVVSEIGELIAEVMTRRYAGERVLDEAIIEQHPHLMPWLAEELAEQARLHRVYLAAQKAGPMEPDSAVAHAVAPQHHAETRDRHASSGVGSILGYQILDEIGGGGQATVYSALQESTGRRVAIKILTGGALAGSRDRARFDREARILAALNHPNIVGIIDRGRTSDASFFLVMPHIDGMPLDQFAATTRASDPQFPRRLLQTFVTIANVVYDAHERGVVHRDLKPSNVRVDDRGEPHLLDFGLARAEAGLVIGDTVERTMTVPGQIVGSLPWASPEHVGGPDSTVDRRSDGYSLGVCLYQCLTGRFPYPIGGSMRDVVDAILTRPPIPLRDCDLTFCDAKALDRVLEKALAKAPTDRYATTADLAADLQALLDAKPVSATALSYARRRLSWRRLTLMIAVILIGSTCAAIAVMHRGPNRLPPPVTVFPQPSFENSIGMLLIKISPGTRNMGSPDTAAHELDERWHQVTLSHAYWIGEREVTCRQYQTVMGKLPPALLAGKAPDLEVPVTFVSWDNAREFCRRLSELEKRHYRLPTEAEWEVACRAGSSGEWAGRNLPDEMGWHAGNSGGSIHQGALKTANHWGIYDMLGNVAEWCADCYQSSYPLSPIDPLVDEGTERIYRGGAFTKAPLECRSAARGKLSPSATRPFLGFRVATDDHQ